MRATEFVTELFAPGKEWKWSFTGSQEAVAVFHVGETPYMFHAWNDNTWGANKEWEVEFKLADNKLDRSQKFGLTGTGNSAEVMSTVVDIMRAFLSKYQKKIKVLAFSAKEDSRQGLYARMAKRLLPDWTMKQEGAIFSLTAPKQNADKQLGENFAEPQAAGCVIVAEDTGRWCLQQRSDTVSDPGVWSTWGGGREPGESLEQCARRELAEESGYRGPVRLEPLSKNAKYMTFIGVVPREFEPAPSDEWKDYCWTELGKWPSPMHPGTAAALENVYINEVFNTQAKGAWKVVPKWMGMDKFEFTASNGIGYRVDFLDPGVGPEEMGPESFSFHLGLGDDVWDKIYDRAKFLEFEQTNINDPYGQGKQGIEGTGAAAEVLGSVANAVYQYIKKNKPSMLYFQAVEPNRRRLYTAMVNRLLKALPGWGFELAGPSDSYFAIYNTRLLKSKPAVAENFADGKVKGKSRPGRVKRAGASCNGSVTDLRKRAKAASGEKAKMYHWCANMKSGRKK